MPEQAPWLTKVTTHELPSLHLDTKTDGIDRAIKETLNVMDKSKYQIFEICENSREEKRALENELNHVMELIRDTISMVDRLETDFRHARIRLSEVSRKFREYTENDIRKAYEAATEIQMDLALYREKEKHLRSRRDELQLRIRTISQTIERAENVFSQMNVMHQYLSGDLNRISQILETAKSRQLLGLKIILAQEDERKRIAREIHDGLAQSMANLVIRSEITERMVKNEALDEAQTEIKALKSEVRGGLEEVRKIIFNLRPMTLDDLGLVPTLRKFTQDFEERNQIATRFHHVGEEVRLGSALEVAIYRFVQEGFSNALKHAKATSIDLVMIHQNNRIEIKIKDDGIGFDLAQLDEKIKEGQHFGLVGMRERVEMLEGRFRLDSTVNKGTTIMMMVPVHQDS